MGEKKGKDLFPSLSDVATSVIFKGVDLSFEFAEKVGSCKNRVVVLVNKLIDGKNRLLDGKNYFPKKKKDNSYTDFNTVNYEVYSEKNISVSTELKNELQDFIDFAQDYLSVELVKHLNKIFEGKFNKYDILLAMTTDLDENQEIYEELLEILDKIDDEIKNENE